MDVFESMVMRHLTHDPNVFVRWQHSIKGADGKQEWSCPDFVAIDMRNHKIIVVEVSSAWDINGLIDKVNKCEEQWFTPLMRQLKDALPGDQPWNSEVRIYARSDSLKQFGHKLHRNPAVQVKTVSLEDEHIAFPWMWES
jgi:hypothetical protein